MTECSTQLLFVADVFWHARPACCKAVVSGGMGSVMFWPWWGPLSYEFRLCGIGLAGLVGYVVGVVVGVACVVCVCCCPLSVRLVMSDEVRADMACCVVVEYSSCFDGSPQGDLFCLFYYS